MKDKASASFHCLLVESGAGDSVVHQARYFSLGHYRGASPRISLLARCSFASPNVSFDQVGGDFSWAIDITFVGEIFRDLAGADLDSDGLLELKIFWAPVPVVSFCRDQGDTWRVDLDAFRAASKEATMIFPPFRQGRDVKDPRLRELEKAMKGLPLPDGVQPPQRPRPRKGGVKVYFPGAIAASDSDGPGSGRASESAPSSQDTDHDEPRPRVPNEVWLYEHGQILINRAGNSLDCLCHACGAGFDRTWKKRQGARQGHTKAQGRPLGSMLCWLHLDCGGDADWHSLMYSDAGLPRADRKARRRQAVDSSDFDALFEQERSPRGSESEGEPLHVPTTRAV